MKTMRIKCLVLLLGTIKSPMKRIVKLKKVSSIGSCYLLVAILIGMLFVSCQSTPQGYLNAFERFVEEVEQDASSYSKGDWSERNEEFEEFVGEKYEKVKDKLSAEDKRVMAEFVVRYYKARIVTSSVEFLNQVGKGVDFLEHFGKELFEEIKPLKEQYLDEVTIDSLLDEDFINKLFEYEQH